jgi:hypothetical protein
MQAKTFLGAAVGGTTAVAGTAVGGTEAVAGTEVAGTAVGGTAVAGVPQAANSIAATIKTENTANIFLDIGFLLLQS